MPPVFRRPARLRIGATMFHEARASIFDDNVDLSRRRDWTWIAQREVVEIVATIGEATDPGRARLADSIAGIEP